MEEARDKEMLPDNAKDIPDHDEELTFEDIYYSQFSCENLAEKLDQDVLDQIATSVMDREEMDKKTLESFRQIIKKGREFAKHNDKNTVYVAAENDSAPDYNIHLPEMKKLITFKASMMLKALHSNVYPVEFDCAQDEKRRERLKKYMRYVLYDSPHSSWLDSMDRTYPVLLAEGMCIRKVEYVPYCHSTESWAIDNEMITVNKHAKSLEQAPAVIWTYPCPLSEIMMRIKRKEILAGPYKELLRGMKGKIYIPNAPQRDQQLYGDEHEMKIAYMEYDLDGDGIVEPYIVEVDATMRKTVSLYANMDAELSKIVDDQPVALYQNMDLVAYRYWQDIEGEFYGYGVYSLFMPLEDCASRIINNTMNVARLATNQGAISMGTRGLDGIRSFKTGEVKNIPNAMVDDINKVIKFPDIKDPSPVMLDLLQVVMGYINEMGNHNDLNQGEMPNRELPSRTASLLLERSDEMNQATYRRIFRSITKEVQILCKQIYHEAKYGKYKEQLNTDYQQIVGDPTANMAQDFNINTLNKITINADPVLNNTSLLLYRISDAFQYFNQLGVLNKIPFSNLIIDALGLTDHADIILTQQQLEEQAKQSPPPIPQQELDLEKQKHTDDMQLEKHKLAADSVKAIGDAAKDLSESQTKDKEAAINLISAMTEAMQTMEGANGRNDSPMGAA